MKTHVPVRTSAKSADPASADKDGFAPPQRTVQATKRLAAPPDALHDYSKITLPFGGRAADAIVHTAAPPSNRTGLPDRLKAGIEHLSGLAMDDVRVRYNSPKPAQLQAHAYAEGADIHVGPGQQRHLPHEAWHVVQQKQGRVKPTLQMKSKAINDDKALEREADHMGVRASQASPFETATAQQNPVRVSAATSLGDGSHKVTAAHEGRPAGALKLHERGSGMMEITDLGVAAPHRGSGVGHRLLGSAFQAALRMGGKRVRLDADDKGNGHLISWYKQMGFSPAGKNVRGQPRLEAPIGKVLGAGACRRVARPMRESALVMQRAAMSASEIAEQERKANLAELKRIFRVETKRDVENYCNDPNNNPVNKSHVRDTWNRYCIGGEDVTISLEFDEEKVAVPEEKSKAAKNKFEEGYKGRLLPEVSAQSQDRKVTAYLDSAQTAHQDSHVQIGQITRSGKKKERFKKPEGTREWHEKVTLQAMITWAEAQQMNEGDIAILAQAHPIGGYCYDGFCVLYNGKKHVFFHCYPARSGQQ